MSSNQDFVLKSNKIQTQPVPSRTGAGSLNGFRADVSKIFPVGTSFWKDIGAGTNEIFHDRYPSRKFRPKIYARKIYGW